MTAVRGCETIKSARDREARLRGTTYISPETERGQRTQALSGDRVCEADALREPPGVHPQQGKSLPNHVRRNEGETAGKHGRAEGHQSQRDCNSQMQANCCREEVRSQFAIPDEKSESDFKGERARSQAPREE